MNQPRKVSDEVIMSEAIRLVDEGVSVTFPVKGRSMLPFIVGGRDSVILEKPTEIRKGDVVLAYVESENREDRHYVVHRIISLDGDRVTLMGDGNLALHEYCNRGDVCAKVSLVVKPNGKKRSLDSFLFRFFAKVWFALLPFRRYLLWIYNKVN
ncbi:MAG: S24/S26 family peptidase [Fibrobacter sp.]|nr:S24/S26 family peptidase [Fibrobacter sp.]